MSLPRSLTLFGAMMLVVGNVVGAGIFTTSGILAQQVGHPAVFIGVWVLGGLLTLSGALTYAELGAMFPRAGGDYQFIKEAWGPVAGFVFGWLSFWIIMPGSIAALSIAIVEYIPGLDASAGWSAPLAAVVIALLVALNVRSTKLAASTQSIVTVGSLILLVGLVLGGAVAGRGSVDHFFDAGKATEGGMLISGGAMAPVFFTYSGWFAAAYVGSEVKRPERNVPLALVVGTLIVTALYTAINAIYLYAVPLSEMAEAGRINVARMAAERLFGPATAVWVSVAIVLAIWSCVNASVMTGARVSYAMAEDGVIWPGFGRIHPRFATPYVAILVQGAFACFLVTVGTFGRLLSWVTFAMMLSSIATGLGHLKLRRLRKTAKRPYRTLGYPATPILFIGAYTWFAVLTVVESPATSAIGIGLALTGLPFYFLIWRSSGRKAPPE